MNVRWVFRTGVALARQPRLWRVAVAETRRLAAPRWWRRPPFLPLPAPAYLKFRLQTMYGDSVSSPEPADVLTWLRWCRDR